MHARRFAAWLVLLLALLPACSREKEKTVSAAPASEPAAPAATGAPAANVPDTGPPAQFNGAAALQFTKQVVAFGPRPVGSAAHSKLENYLRAQLKGADVEEDAFTAQTPVGPKPMRNFIARIPGAKDGVIVVCGHYDTLHGRPDFVGANDGGSSTGLLLELAKELSPQKKNGKLDGNSVWLVFLDGEEAIQQWTATDSVYGARHLAEKWQSSGVLKQIKALLLVDMIGDADLDILRDTNSAPWLEDLVYQAATRLGYQSHFFTAETAMEDDHRPFAARGVPSADIIDFNYGYNNAYWHSREDTMDKLSAKSFEIVGSVVEQTIRYLNLR